MTARRDAADLGVRVTFAVGYALLAACREAGRCLAAVFRVLRWHNARRARRAHLERYQGLLGPWRHAHDSAAGVKPPPAPQRPPATDILRAYAVVLGALAWAVGGAF